ncbi:MAG: sigma-70 family RNA polymerase sigma factor [Bacteroidota bacterium]
MTSTSQQYITGIRRNDPAIVRQLYSEYLPAVVKYVCNNNGTAEDAKDVFQDAILICYEKLQQETFVVEGELGGYLYGICRFVWLRKLKKNKNAPITFLQEKEQVVDLDWVEAQVKEEKWQLFQSHFNRLGKDCQQVLQSFFNGMRLGEIAKQMGYTNTYIKLKKHQCKERLTKWIQADKHYRSLSRE